MDTELLLGALGAKAEQSTFGVASTIAFRVLLVWFACTLVLIFRSGRQERLLQLSLLFRFELPLLLVVLGFGIQWAGPRHLPQFSEAWGMHTLPVTVLCFGLAFRLPPFGKRLAWNGSWDFRYPLTNPGSETERRSSEETLALTPSRRNDRQHARQRRRRLRTLGYLTMLIGLGVTAAPAIISSHPEAFPDWLLANRFPVGLTGLVGIWCGRQILNSAWSQPARTFPPLSVREDAWVGARLWLAASLWRLAGGLLLLGAMAIAVNAAIYPFWVILAAFPAMILGGAGYTCGQKTLHRARRHLTRTIPGPRSLEAGSYVLYLRSFEEDERRAAIQERPSFAALGGGLFSMWQSGRSAEQHIAAAFQPVGSLIAIGEPGEVLTHVGALRMYLPAARTEWQREVRQLMRRCRLTVLTLGTSEGTMWELAQALHMVPPQRLVLLLPPMEKPTYERIRAETDAGACSTIPALSSAKSSPARLPDCPSWLAPDHPQPVQGIIDFAAEGSPTVTKVASHLDLTANLLTVLLPGLRRAFAALQEYEVQTQRHCG